MITIALAGNPNSGKTTLFNALTGSNQYVGNWPGVTVERKEARFELEGEEATLVDLPGVYSLSPYSIEENITRHFIAQHSPDVVLNIVDATNLERNLYLTFQLLELSRPVVVALNLMDEVRKNGGGVDCAASRTARPSGCRGSRSSRARQDRSTLAGRLDLRQARRCSTRAPAGTRAPRRCSCGWKRAAPS